MQFIYFGLPIRRRGDNAFHIWTEIDSHDLIQKMHLLKFFEFYCS